MSSEHHIIELYFKNRSILFRNFRNLRDDCGCGNSFQKSFVSFAMHSQSRLDSFQAVLTVWNESSLGWMCIARHISYLLCKLVFGDFAQT